MTTTLATKGRLILCIIFSAAAHATALGIFPHFGSYHFTRPVCAASSVEVQLGESIIEATPPSPPKKSSPAARQQKEMAHSPHPAPPAEAVEAVKEVVAAAPPNNDELAATENAPHLPAPPAPAKGSGPPAVTTDVPGGRDAAAYLSAVREKLSYQVFLLGMPVGSAVLEAKKTGSDVTISWTVRSNPMASGFFRVDDQAEARLVGGGQYLISRMRQQEGSFRSDTGFTLCLREKKAFWFDRLHNLTTTQPLEGEETTDIFFGFYYLRNRTLEVGKTVQLQIFDSNRTVTAPVEVLRRERIGLSLGKELDTVVLRPTFNTDTFFKGTGALTIWLTDDGNKVPVRLETSLPLGTVRAELVSAEVELSHPSPPLPSP